LFFIGIKLSDGKPLQGKGRLTQKRIDSFQVFYGVALRSKTGDLDAMCRSTNAILEHYSSLDDDNRHRNCPDGADSWCKWRSDQVTGQTTYKPPKHPLPPAVVSTIQPIFNDLSDRKLLTACLHGYTQNQNEALHHVIWSLVPKEQQHSPIEVQLGIDMAVMFYNRGMAVTNKAIFQALG